MMDELHAAVAAVSPIHGVAIGIADDKNTWRVDFRDEATESSARRRKM